MFVVVEGGETTTCPLRKGDVIIGIDGEPSTPMFKPALHLHDDAIAWRSDNFLESNALAASALVDDREQARASARSGRGGCMTCAQAPCAEYCA